ncbi:hypothetical protein LCL95_12165 [Bacillus timonensis]|nr:hypothetical protein [Bacillus timonensis]
MNAMEPSRKKVIINEISHWKENKLLPEHYCNFLLTLYSQGEFEQDQEMKKKTKIAAMTIFICSFIVFLFLTFLVIYFTEMFLNLQIPIFIIFLIVCLLLGFFFKKNIFIQHFIFIVTALILLLFSVQITDIYLSNDRVAMYVTLLINSCIWVFIGQFSGKKYFLISGIIAIIILIVVFFL